MSEAREYKLREWQSNIFKTENRGEQPMFPRKKREGSPMSGTISHTPKRENILTHIDLNQVEMKKVNT